MIQNPILPGFNPDPSICRAGNDFYIATSTFEWYPGVQIHHSRNLAKWRLIHRPLDRPDLLDMEGVPDSCGIWAPCLSWHDGLFYLCYTVVRRFDGNFKDSHNYLSISSDITGPWSDPVYLNSSGFDPSLFHDADGRKWYLNMVWDHRPDRTHFHGISLQEYDPARKALLGERKLIFEGSELGLTEGPHLYRYDDYYYLLTAEGGTGYEHACTMARARNIEGPYEVDPDGSLLTTRNTPDHPLQRAGHGSIVETLDGRFFLCHLCSRPLPDTRISPMGRETGIQELVRAEQGWFRLKAGGVLPELHVAGLSGEPVETGDTDGFETFDSFEESEIAPQFQWLRTPWPERFLSLTDRPDYLRMRGMESPGSHFIQSLLARRQVSFNFEAVTAVEFEPRNFQQMAGLICYYNSSKFHYCFISHDEECGKHLAVMSCEGDSNLQATFPQYEKRISLPSEKEIFLRARVGGSNLEFDWSMDGNQWQNHPARLEHSLLSDEAGIGENAQFTGAFVGMCCNDVSGARIHADFRFFSYSGNNQEP